MIKGVPRASRDTICWLLSGSELDNNQQMDAYELIDGFVGVDG